MSEVTWSDYRDPAAGTVREAIERSPHREVFERVLEKFAARTNRHEQVKVFWWAAPYVYVEVEDSRQHYPCNGRALISFDLTNGTFAGWDSRNRYVFARHGWGSFVDAVAGWNVPRYATCPDPERAGNCPAAA